MQVSEKWSTKLTYHEEPQPVYVCAIKADLRHVSVGSGSHLKVFDLKDGTLLHDFKKHKGTIYSIDYSTNSIHLATSGADKQIMIWDWREYKGLVKINNNSVPTILKFSPVSPHLLICADREVSIWNPSIKAVSPMQTQSKILSATWSPDGKKYALGHINGTLSVRNSDNNQEIYTHHLQIPVFSLCWSNDSLIAGDWDNRLTIHKVQQSQMTSTVPIPAQPSCITNFQSNILVTDIAGGVSLYNDDGQLLSIVTNVNEWIWSCSVCSDGYMALAMEDGTLSLLSLGLRPIYSIYHNAFAIRTELTKVELTFVGTDLSHDVEFIKPVQSVSVTDTQIAIGFSDEISTYSIEEVNGKIKLVKLDRFDTNGESREFYVFSNSFMFVYEKSVKILSSKGSFIREFTFSASVTASTICSTIQDIEGIIVGLEDGQVIQVFVDHLFSHLVIKHDCTVKRISISQMKTKFAVIDDKNRCCVYNSLSGKLLFIEESVNNACWNELNDDLLAMSDGENVFVKACDMQCDIKRVKTQMKGELCRFSGLTVSTIIDNKLVHVDVPLNTAVKALTRNNDFERAYQIAVFGSTEDQWNDLADSALRQRNVGIAIKAASKAANTKLLHFIEMISHQLKDSKFSQDHLSAEVDAWTNNFDSAARTWTRLGENERAVHMYFDLRQFEKLKQFLSGDRMKKFALSQARSFEDMNEIELAAELYVVGGEAMKGVALLSDNNKIDALEETSQKIDHQEMDALRAAADALQKHGRTEAAMKILATLADVNSLAKLRVIMKDWDEALSLAKMHQDLIPEVFLPFARHLFEDDQYFESLVSFFIAGQVDEALKSLNTLLENAIIMNKFDDVAFFLYGRSLGMSSICQNSQEAELIVQSGLELARAYSALGRLREDTNSPFTVRERGSSFYLARFVVSYINSIRHGEFKAKYMTGITEELLRGLSFSEALFSLLNESDSAGEYRLMRWCAEKLSLHLVPPAVQEAVDLAILRTAGMNDDDEGESCERCGSRLFSGSEGPLLWCSECKCPIVFSSYSYRVIPLVPVTINGVDVSEAKELINQDPPIDGSVLDVGEVIDPSHAVNGEAKPVLNQDALKKIDPSCVITCEWKENSKVPSSFILNPPLDSVHLCRGCNSVFNDVDYEQTFLENGACPICKTPIDGEAEGEYADTYESYSDLLKQLREFSSNVPIYF